MDSCNVAKFNIVDKMKELSAFQQKMHDLLIEYATSIYPPRPRAQKTAKDYTESLERYLPKEAKNRFGIDFPDTAYDIKQISELQRIHDMIEDNPEWKKYDQVCHASTFRSGLKCLISMLSDKNFMSEHNVFGYPTTIDYVDDFTNKALLEGASRLVTCTHYERKTAYRKACIAKHGCKCSVCDFDFEATFGEIGKGFIHVHHINQLSLQGEAKAINPETDLIPVCPNCHAMLHSKPDSKEPYTVDELRQIRSQQTTLPKPSA